MSFETNIRSIESAVHSAAVKVYGYTGSATLVADGVEIKLTKEKSTIYNLVEWHSLAMYQGPTMGSYIVSKMIADANPFRSWF